MFLLWTQHPETSTRRSTGRWNDKCCFAFDAVSKSGPLVHVPRLRPCSARRRPWQIPDYICRENIGPHVDICQGSLERLSDIKAPSDWILFLSQNQWSPSPYRVSNLKTPTVHVQHSILVELPCAITVPPWCADVVPFAIISWFLHSPVTQ